MRARDNPFRSECLEQVRYRLHDMTWEALLARCAAMQYRGALVGPCGSGKTTLLEQLGTRLQQAGLTPCFIRLDDDQPKLCRVHWRALRRRFCRGVIVLLDGAERLNRWQWCSLKWQTRRASGFIVTGHRPGLLPTLWQCRTSPDLLKSLVAELVENSSIERLPDLDSLFQQHNGNIREALRHCYEHASAGVSGSAHSSLATSAARS